MKFANKYVLFFCCCLIHLFGYNQKSTDKLKKDQERLEKQIANSKNLLEKTKSTAEATLNELKLIDTQVKTREELLSNFDNQIRGTEVKIEQKNQQIEQLEAKLASLIVQYKKLTLYAYKRRSKEGKLMYVFSSNNYFEALKRKKYLEKIAEIQRKQKLIIKQHKKLIFKEKRELIEDKSYKEKIAYEKRLEKEEILKDKEIQTRTLNKLKSEEQKLTAKIQQDEKKKLEIKQRIDQALAASIKKEKKQPAGSSDKSKGGTSNNGGNDKPKVVKVTESVEYTLNQNFESNKGRLPWPVRGGTIIEGYGKNAHPTLKNVTTFNNGVDISAAKGAQVLAVFEGEVTAVIPVDGAGKIVIIKHGNYRTVYSNLKEVYVSEGSKVNTKQSIGSLLVSEGESISISHFEVHQVVGSDVNRLNPGLWLSR